MVEKVAIMGAGGHAHVVASVLKANHIDIFGCFDDSFSSSKVENIRDFPLLGRLKDIVNYKEKVNSVYLASGNNQIRKALFETLTSEGFILPAICHPSSLIEDDVEIDSASVICLGGLIATEAKIGKGCIVNTGCSIDHETIIGDFVHLAPNSTVAGRTIIGDGTFVGMNVVIADQLKIGRNVVIGAGSVVLTDVPDGTTVFGVHR